MSKHEVNERLPFDILGHIFSNYADEETIHYPLETLLLVCKSRSHAALGHRTLWNHPRIYLKHEPVPTIWNARLPLRLARCGPDIPLDVDLRNFLYVDEVSEAGLEIEREHLVPQIYCESYKGAHFNVRRCRCDRTMIGCIRRSLRELIGDKGEICARWRSLTLYLGNDESIDVSNALSCPTPNLEHLELGRVRIYAESATAPLFPDARKLKRLSLFNCHLPSLPNCDNLLDLSVESSLHRPPDLSALRSASQLQALSLRLPSYAETLLPAQLHHLRVLKIYGETDIDNTGLLTCQVPLLSHLSLDYQYENLLHSVLLCEGLPVEKLMRVTLTWEMEFLQGEDDLAEVMESLQVFMTRARNLKHLEVDGQFVCLVIKVLWNSRRHQVNHNPIRASDLAEPLFNTGYLTRILKRETIQFDGTQTRLFLEELAKKWGCLGPDLPNDEFVGRKPAGHVRSLILYLGPEEEKWPGGPLSHATPILESLELGDIRHATGDRFLPEVPRLKRLSLVECRLPFLPNCENLVDVKIASSNILAFGRASKLQVLSLGSIFDVTFRLPAQLNDLRVVKIEGIDFSREFDECVCHMPRLFHLFIDLTEGNVITRVLRFQWIPLERLTRITITWRYRTDQTEQSCIEMMAAIRHTLGRTWNLKWLAADRAVLCFIIKVLWNSLDDPVNEGIAGPDGLPGPVFKNVSLTNIFDEDTVEFDGSETTSFLEDLAKKWHFLPPDLPDYEFAQRMVTM